MKGDINEYYIEARVVQENTARSQVEVKVYNDTSIPPRYVDDIKCRYFFNINELLAAGQTIDNVQVDIFYDEENANTNGESFATISEPVKWDDNGTYYVEISWEGCEFYGKRVFHFGLIADMDSEYKTNWDPTDDYSREGIELSEDELKLTEKIPVYVDNKLVWGAEPEGGNTTEPTGEVTLGDVNDDGDVDIQDLVALCKHFADVDAYPLSEQSQKNADVVSDGEITNIDCVMLLKYVSGQIDKF